MSSDGSTKSGHVHSVRQETINVTRFPKCVSVKRSKTASLPGSKGFQVNRDVCVITSGCAKCGRPFEEIEKKLKEEGLI